jgi:hypothetical protein
VIYLELDFALELAASLAELDTLLAALAAS